MNNKIIDISYLMQVYKNIIFLTMTPTSNGGLFHPFSIAHEMCMGFPK